MSRPQEVEIKCRFIRETEAAVLIKVDGDEHWIPLSQVSEMHKVGDDGRIVVAQWVASQKGFI